MSNGCTKFYINIVSGFEWHNTMNVTYNNYILLNSFRPPYKTIIMYPTNAYYVRSKCVFFDKATALQSVIIVSE